MHACMHIYIHIYIDAYVCMYMHACMHIGGARDAQFHAPSRPHVQPRFERGAGGEGYLGREAARRAQLLRHHSAQRIQRAWRRLCASRRTSRALAEGFVATGGCWGVLGCAGVCWGVLGCAGVCWGVPGCAGECWGVLGVLGVCPLVPSRLIVSRTTELALNHT